LNASASRSGVTCGTEIVKSVPLRREAADIIADLHSRRLQLADRIALGKHRRRTEAQVLDQMRELDLLRGLLRGPGGGSGTAPPRPPSARRCA